jgi:hypothetical protein
MKIEFDVKTLEISGFVGVFKALRLPFGKECRSECWWYGTQGETQCTHHIDEKDLTLLSTLVKRGDEHSKAIRGLIVYAEINAPRYWWQEMDTYRIGTDRLSSESTMHIQGRGMSEEELLKMKSDLTEGTMQKRVQVFSYQTLRRIYFQRRSHRLPHWREFCQWIESLPLASELITIQD